MRFAVILSIDCANTRAGLDELCQLLSHDTGLSLSPLVARSPSGLADALAAGDAQFAWLSPTLLFMLPKLATMVPLLSSVREDVAFFHAVLFAAGASPIRSLGDLQDARAAWVAPTSAAGYLVPRLALARHGIDIRRAFSHEEFFGTHGAVARAVFAGEADVGATYAHFEGGDSSRRLLRAGFSEVDRDAHLIDVAGPIPADMIVAHPDVPVGERIAIAASLSRMPSDPVGRAALRTVIGADDFRAVGHAAMNELTALIRAAGDLG
ncbi:MAG TPA: PhnD/SsuA/transferrin family substrate-binding protein [Polyangiaceae bacterium]|nr:PhnD/SsuA/transferrin family substrate-binding protein [Polyangiaceae bacterium]